MNYKTTLGRKITIDDKYKDIKPFLKSEIFKDIGKKSFFIKNSLDIENEGSSKKVTNEIISGKIKPRNDNEQLIANMSAIMDYIMTSKPDISHESINIIYRMLTTKIDMGDNTLDGKYYRSGPGQIGKKETIKADKVEKCMNELIEAIGSHGSPIVDSVIATTVFVLIHPYYDYNGKMSRIIGWWIMVLSGNIAHANIYNLPYLFDKQKYFKILSSYHEGTKHDFNEIMKFYRNATNKIIDILLTLNGKSLFGIRTNDTDKIICLYLGYKGVYLSKAEVESVIKLSISRQAMDKSYKYLEEKEFIIASKGKKNWTYKYNIEIDELEYM